MCLSNYLRFMKSAESLAGMAIQLNPLRKNFGLRLRQRRQHRNRRDNGREQSAPALPHDFLLPSTEDAPTDNNTNSATNMRRGSRLPRRPSPAGLLVVGDDCFAQLLLKHDPSRIGGFFQSRNQRHSVRYDNDLRML